MALVGYHCLAPYCGAWPLPSAYASSILTWVGKLLYNGMLETFVFISGYLCAVSWQKRNTRFGAMVKQKLRRLYLPCICWGCLILLLFPNEESLWQNAASIVNGKYHLWFLPMLFWCFVIEYFIVHLPLKPRPALLLLLVAALLPYPGLPLYLNSSFYYVFFFHTGYLCYKEREVCISLCYHKLTGGGNCDRRYSVCGTYLLGDKPLPPRRSTEPCEQSRGDF